MATDSNASVGDVYVDVLPDIGRFAQQLRADLAAKNLPAVKVQVNPDTARFASTLRADLAARTMPSVKVVAAPNLAGFNRDLRAQLAALPNQSVRVQATPDLRGFNRDLRAALAGLPNLTVRVDVAPRISGFNRDLRAALAALPAVSTSVRIDPNVVGFSARLRAALATLPGGSVRISVSFPGATTTGTRIGNAAAAAFLTAFRTAIAAARFPPVGPSPAASARAGAESAGAYGTAFRAGIEAALRDLPTPTIGVATSAAEQAVRDLRLSLVRLGAERVGVTITAEQARLEITRLRADIDRLRASGLDIDVDANVRGAQLHLAQLETQLDAIGRDRTANVRVNDGGSTSRLGLLVTLITAIGPAAIPAGAAAVGALVAITNAAIGTVAGVGVAVLALSGIGGAVKALGTAQQARIKDQASLVRQDRQLACGADQVKSAIASLANTRASAADGARRAAESIANSERDLGRAQRDALAAQADITRARKDAKEALEDLDSQVKSNGDSIARANIALVDAEKALLAVQNLKPDDRRRVEAQLTYNEARHQVDDLTIRQGRLATEKEAADKAGIEGSTQVAAAQAKIADSQEKVRDAERAVGDARIAAAEQARQSAFSIAQAQQAVVSAQRSAAAAVQSATTDAGGAADALRDKLAGLSPAGQGFARFIFGLKGDFTDLRQAAETGFLPAFQRGLQGVLVYEPQIVAFVSHVADGMGRISETQLKAFGQEPSRGFFKYLSATAVPTLDQVVTSIGNIARGLGSVIVAFAPVNSQVGSGLLNLTTKFANWGATLDKNQQFQRFLDYTITRGPQVTQTIDRLFGAVFHTLDAIAPVGDAVLLVIRGIANAIDAIPVPILTAAYTAFLAFRIAGLVTPLVMGLANGIRAVATGSVNAGAAAGRFTSFLGGPWTIAIAAATVAIGFLVQRAADTRARVDQLRQAFSNYGSALKDGVNPASLENAKATLAQNSQLRGLITTLRDAGVSQKVLVDGINGDRDARKQILAVLDQQIAQQRELAKAEAAAAGEDNPIVNPAYQKRITQLEDLRKAFSQTNAANAEANDLAATGAGASEDAAAASAKLTASWRESGIAARGLNSEQADLVRTMATLGDATSTATEKADAFRHAYDLLFGAVQKQSQATDDYQSKLLGLKDSVDNNGTSLDNHTKAGLGNRDAMREALRAIIELDAADLQNGLTLDQVKVKHDQRIVDLEAEARKLGLSKQATFDLVTQYGQIPSNVQTDFTSDGVEVVKAAFRDILTDVQYLLKYGYLPPRATGDSNHPSGGQKFVADGGYISGPGGPRDDLIPAWLSNGEFVQQAAATSYYGVQFMDALNRRQIPRGVLPGYAAGGFVQLPTQAPGVNPYRRPPVQDGPALAGALGFDFATIGTDIIRKQVIDEALRRIGAGGGGGEESIKAFIRHADSLPYVFGDAGPDAFDCCLPGRSLIHGPDGPRRIDEIQAGDRVYSRTDDGDLVDRKVVKAWRSADQPTFRLKVRGRNIDGSANHPFLRVRSERVRTTGMECSTDGCVGFARGRGVCGTCYARLSRHNALPETYPQVTRYWTEWVRLDELKRDDMIVVLDEAPDLPADQSPVLPDGTSVNERLAWLLGALIGDGTVSRQSVRLAAFGDFADEATAAFAEVFGLTAYPHWSAGLIVNSARLARELWSLGFWRRGEDKRIPDMVWSWPRRLKLAFCSGYAAADGHKGRDGQSYASCSRRLIDEVRTIHLEAGHRVSNVTTNYRTKPITIKGKLVKNAKPLHNFVVSSLEREPYVWVKDGGAAAAADALTGGAFGLRRILGVESLGTEPTYDLNIEENHNFVADGVLVHNSGLAGAVYGLMLGLPGATSRRFFTTYDFENHPPAGFKPGVGGIYSVGVNPQTHMAGVYGGLKFEAANSRVGIKVGPSAREVGTFQKQFHVQLADGGLVDDELAKRLGLTIGGDPSGMTINGLRINTGTFDTGGELPPGATLAWNGTGRTEYVNTAEQQRDLVGAASRSGGDSHYHFTGVGPEAYGQFKAHQDREAILSRPGRPR